MLDIQNVSKRYGKTLANDGVSFSVAGGELAVLLGPNGAGKSTLISASRDFCASRAIIQICPAHVALEAFPDTAEKLDRYSLVILSDVGANTLMMTKKSFRESLPAPDRCKALRAYVERGGALVMVGGFMSFHRHRGQRRATGVTPIADVLPVRLLPTDDRVETSEGSVPVILRKDIPFSKGFPTPGRITSSATTAPSPTRRRARCWPPSTAIPSWPWASSARAAASRSPRTARRTGRRPRSSVRRTTANCGKISPTGPRGSERAGTGRSGRVDGVLSVRFVNILKNRP